MVIVRPASRWTLISPSELWQFRELGIMLAQREISVRYRQSILGVLWVIIQPAVTVLVFSLLFNRLLGVPSAAGVPYPVHSYSGLILWGFFAGSVGRSAQVLVANRGLLTKVYFPRVFIPLSVILASLVDLIAAGVVFGVLLVATQTVPSGNLLLIPVSLLMAVSCSIGMALLVSAMNVRYRDVQQAVPFILQLMMYCSPIIYPIEKIPEQWHWLYSMNPMVLPIQLFRSAVLGTPIDVPFVNGVAIAFTLLVLGLWYFHATERRFADIV